MTGYFVNPLFLYLTVWAAVVALYTGGLEAGLFPSATPQVAWVIVLSVTTFVLGYLTWDKLGGLTSDRRPLPQTANRPLTLEQLKKYLNTTLCFGLLAVVLCAVRVATLAEVQGVELRRLTADPHLWRRVVTSVITPDMSGARLCTIGITLSYSLFSIGFVLLGILVYVGRSPRRYGYVLLFLLTSLATGMLSLARKEVATNILFAVLSYLSMHQLYRTRHRREIVRHLVAPAVAAIILFLLIELALKKGATYERQGRLAGFVFSIYWYLASPLAAFGEYLKGHVHAWRLGQNLFFPFYKWLVRLHFLAATDTTNIVQMEWVLIPYPANVYTYLRSVYEDFGFFGIVAVPYLLGALSAYLRCRAGRSLAYLNLYLVVLILLVFSFYDYLLISNQFYLQVVFGFVIFRREFDPSLGGAER